MLRSTLALLSVSFLLFSCSPDNDDITLNQVPVANAGPSQTYQLPTPFINVNGTGADGDGTVVAYLWSQVSGATSTTIMNPGAASTQISGFSAGTYVFQLMVTDEDGATGVDTTTLTFTQAPTQTLTLQPANNPSEILLADLNGLDQSNPNPPDLHISRWTNGGTPYVSRAAFKFDLSSIPANATIESARLYLYSYPSPTLTGNFTDANSGTDNSLILRQITSNWAETSLNWSGQPSVTSTNELIIPSTNLSMLDLNLDVKNMVSSMVSSSANYGFLIRLQNEAPVYNIRIFVSSSNTTYSEKRPKLVVTYH